MKFSVLTIFPDMIENALSESILGRARKNGIIEAEAVDIRPFSKEKHKNTDDTPFGGGAGMVMTAQPLRDAMQQVCGKDFKGRRVYLSPKGATFTQKKAEELAREDALVLVCGHYEGVDQRFIDAYIDEEISVGDYVLTGGELGALIIIDAVARLVPGVLGSDESSVDESFSSGLLEYPQYTRPREFEGRSVPEVLTGGNQALIDRWRRDEAIKLTFARRRELLDTLPLDKFDRALIRKLTPAKPTVYIEDCPNRAEIMARLDMEYADAPEDAEIVIRPPFPALFAPIIKRLKGDEGIKNVIFEGISAEEFDAAAREILPLKKIRGRLYDYGKNRAAMLKSGSVRRVKAEFFDGSTETGLLPELPEAMIEYIRNELTERS